MCVLGHSFGILRGPWWSWGRPSRALEVPVAGLGGPGCPWSAVCRPRDPSWAPWRSLGIPWDVLTGPLELLGVPLESLVGFENY